MTTKSYTITLVDHGHGRPCEIIASTLCDGEPVPMAAVKMESDPVTESNTIKFADGTWVSLRSSVIGSTREPSEAA